MKEIVQDELNAMIAQVDGEIERLVGIRKNLVNAKESIELAFAPVDTKFMPKPVRDMRKVRRERREVQIAGDIEKSKVKVQRRCSWVDVREVLKQMYPDMLTVNQIAELLGVPRTIVSFHTSSMRRLLKREYVREPGKLHWCYKMTLRNPPIEDGLPVGATVQDK